MSCICSSGLGHFQPASSPVACLPPLRAFPSLAPLATRALSKQRGALHPPLRLPHHSHRVVCWAGARCEGCEHLCKGRCSSQLVAVLAGEGIHVLVTPWAAGAGGDDAGCLSSLSPAESTVQTLLRAPSPCTPGSWALPTSQQETIQPEAGQGAGDFLTRR